MDPMIVGSGYVSGSDTAKQGSKLTPPMSGEEKKAAVDEELRRASRLPQNSSYAAHRLRVLSKIKQLLSIQRTTSQDEELELLFAGLRI